MIDGEDLVVAPTLGDIEAVLVAMVLALSGRLGGMAFGMQLTDRIGLMVVACPGGLFLRPLLAIG